MCSLIYMGVGQVRIKMMPLTNFNFVASTVVLSIVTCTIVSGLDEPSDTLKYIHNTNSTKDGASYQDRVDARCAFCMYFMQGLEGYLLSPTVHSQLNGTVLKSCQQLIHSTLLCDELSQLVWKIYIDIVETELAPKKACTSIGYCQKGAKYSSATVLKDLSARLAAPETDSFLCDMCKVVIHELDTFVAGLVMKGKSLVDEFCRRLVPPVVNECLSETDRLFKEVFDMLSHGKFSADAVCTQDIPVCT